MTDGRVTVAPPLDVFKDGCEFWKSTLVGHFVTTRFNSFTDGIFPSV